MAQAPAVADEEEEEAEGGTRGGSQLSSRWRSADLAASADSKVDSLHLSFSFCTRSYWSCEAEHSKSLLYPEPRYTATRSVIFDWS